MHSYTDYHRGTLPKMPRLTNWSTQVGTCLDWDNVGDIMLRMIQKVQLPRENGHTSPSKKIMFNILRFNCFIKLYVILYIPTFTLDWSEFRLRSLPCLASIDELTQEKNWNVFSIGIQIVRSPWP
jgi:hypothetical protein